MSPRLLPLLLLCTPMAAFAGERCDELQQFHFAQTEITQAVTVPAATATTPGADPSHPLPAFCRVAGVLRPSADSAIRFEVWLPEVAWNDRLLNVGNGGFAGSIGYRQMAGNVLRGFATAGTDAGHEAEAEDASWAYGHPERIVDFGYRAVHLTTLVSKALVQAFYTRPQVKAYFDACSDGGREALMEAQRFPEDYDGILAGAPAYDWSHLLTAGVALLQSTARDPGSYISTNKLPAISAAALAACDAQDGLKDGILSDPMACRFDPQVLLCQSEENARCLTQPQIAALRSIYGGAHDAHRQVIFPGLLPGTEALSWRDWVIGNAPGAASNSSYVTGYFRYMVLNDPTWNVLTADPGSVLQRALSSAGHDVDATDPDLSRFAAHGGKLLVYHGWNDPAISPQSSVHYYEAVHHTMGDASADKSMRLYMVPGMEHCAGGPGPNTFGQLSMPPAAGKGSGALDLLQEWVERGQAPGPLLAAKVLPATLTAKPSGPAHRQPAHRVTPRPAAMVRPICPYPQQAAYDGHGDPNRPKSFRCVAH